MCLILRRRRKRSPSSVREAGRGRLGADRALTNQSLRPGFPQLSYSTAFAASNATMVKDPARAHFAFVALGDALPDFAQCNLGTQDYPDRSTTIVAEMRALTGGPKLMLRGPGIAETQEISPVGLPGDFVRQWSENRALFPRGIDLLLVADGQVMGLPRSTRIVEA